MVRSADFGAWFRASTIVLLLGLMLAFAQPALAEDEPQRFSVEVMGEGPDVILIPGLSTPRDVWAPTAEILQDRYRLHLVQVRGFGEPAGINSDGPILDDMVAELAAYIEAQGLEKPAIIGHSLGGLSALMLGAQYPDLAGRLLIVDALPWYGTLVAPGAQVTMEMLEPQAAMLRDGMKAQAGQPMSAAAIDANTASQSLTPQGRALVAQWIARADQGVTGQLVYDDITKDIRAEIVRITTPVTVLVPFADPYPTEDIATELFAGEYAALDGVEVKAIGPSRHFIMLDAPEAFMAEVENFLAQ